MVLSPGISLAYTDVQSDSPYYFGVEYLRRNKVFPEVEVINAERVVSRAEFITYLVKLYNSEFKPLDVVDHLPFSDTKITSWYAPYLKEAINLGILSENQTEFYPDQPIRVLDAVRILFQANSIPIPRKHVGPVPYNDVRGTENEALIMRAIQLNVVQPQKSDYVGVIRPLTRGQVALMIYRMDKLNLVPGSVANQVDISNWDVGLQKIINSWELVNQTYVDPESIDQTKMADAAVEALVDSLGDPYSTYFDQQENRAFLDDTEGEIEGIGAFIGFDENHRPAIISPIQGSPAEAAGVLPGDIILRVDDVDVSNLSIEEIAGLIKGPRGTSVRVDFERKGATITIEVKRDLVLIKSVLYKVVNGNIAHIELVSFSMQTRQQLREIAEQINENKNIKGIILDMRNNPGGLLDTAIEVLSYFVDDRRKAVYIKQSTHETTYETNGNGDLSALPMVVLINKGSASASEIVAGALKEYGRATLIGETSFGKGSVQQINYFNDNSSLKVTIAKWFTPEHHSIQGNGVTPDIEVIDNPNTPQDEIMERGIRELNQAIK
ncbi:S41 family peptidase [Candidatus Peregrinibacteria bacterium]|nr:MAG: S41 family peptidase [Candidatus Peregrinibacteria bacterium]